MESKKILRDWKELPSELLRLITNKLSDLLYMVRFRAVCKAWRCAPSLADAPPQFPWLLEVTALDHHSSAVLQEEFRFYALFSGETGTIRIKQFPHPSYFTGPSCGSLLVHDSCTKAVSLINPLSNDRREHAAFKGRMNTWPVWTGKDPLCNPNMIVVDRFSSDSVHWVVLFERTMLPMYGGGCSVCYLRGMLFMSMDGGSTLVFDTALSKTLYEIHSSEDEQGPQCPEIYLIESAGVILRVSRSGNYQQPIFLIYQLDFGQTKSNPSWVKLTSIGDQMLFLDVNNGFSMSATSFVGFRGNCIYFLSSGRKPCRYDIANGIVESLLCPFERCTWYLPCLQYLHD